MDIKDQVKKEIDVRYYDYVDGIILSRLRPILFVGIFMHVSSFILDRFSYPAIAPIFLKIELVDAVLILAVISVSYIKVLKRHVVWLVDLAGCILIIGMGMFILITGCSSSRFYEGGNLVYLGYCIINSFYIPHMIVCILLWLGYNDMLMVFGHAPFNLSDFLWANYFMASTATLVFFLTIFYKIQHYKAFVRQEQLKISAEELRLSSEELARSNKELEQYAYAVSHDLQEPLRMVSSFCRKLDEAYRDKFDENAREYLHFAVDGANRMQELIKGLLSYARLENKQDMKIKEVDLNFILKTILHDLDIVIKEKKAVVKVGRLPVIMTNEVQMSQLFQNFLTNALKFKGERDPVVEVSAQKTGNEWQFSISDNGIGIDEQHFAQIFVIFQRLHGRTEYPGTGIGLAMCKKIVENFGGKVWVTSKIGLGTTFHFTLNVKEC